MSPFGRGLFAWSILEWLVLPSEMSTIFVAHLALYTWGLRLFLYSFQCEIGVMMIINPSKSWQGQWLLWLYVYSVSLGKMVTSSCRTSGGWSQVTVDTHLCLPNGLSSWLSDWEEDSLVLLMCWPLTQTPSINAWVRKRSPGSLNHVPALNSFLLFAGSKSSPSSSYS